MKTKTLIVAGVGSLIAVASVVGLTTHGPTSHPFSRANQTVDFEFDANEPMAPFRGGNKTLDYVLAHADSMPAMSLLVGASTAYRSGRIEDAAFLLYAGRIRAKYDLAKYEPKATGGDSPAVFLAFLVHNASESIVSDIFFRPKDYAGMVQRLEAWKIVEPKNYNPGWEYVLRPISPDLADRLKTETLDDAKPLATLLNIPEYLDALKAMRAYNELPPNLREDAAAYDRYSLAEQTMQRIEREKELKGIYCQMNQKAK